MTVEEQVREIAERVAASYGLEVVEVELHGGGKARRLRITIDRVPQQATAGLSLGENTAAHGNSGTDIGEGAQVAVESGQAAAGSLHAQGSGVTLDDCERVSREVGIILDVEEVVPGASYTLEVSSPGLDRKLKAARDYQRFTGSRVKLMTREAINGQRHFEGRLQRFENGRLTLEITPPRSRKKQKEQPATGAVEVELANVEKANLVPEF